MKTCKDLNVEQCRYCWIESIKKTYNHYPENDFSPIECKIENNYNLLFKDIQDGSIKDTLIGCINLGMSVHCEATLKEYFPGWHRWYRKMLLLK